MPEKKEKIIVAKNVELILDRNPVKSKLLVDGKLIPFRKIEIEQDMDNFLQCKVTLFPHKVIWIK